MKKLLCVLLAAALLLSFTAIFATANDLQAQGEALLRETFDVFESEAGFTLRSEGVVVTRQGERFAICYGEELRAPERWLLGSRGHTLQVGNRHHLVFPGRRLQLDITAMGSRGVNPFWHWITRGGMPETVQVTQVTLDGNAYIRVFDGSRAFFYQDGQLRRAVVVSHWGREASVIIESLEATPEQSLVNTSGFIRLPFMVWAIPFIVATPIMLPIDLIRSVILGEPNAFIEFWRGLFVPEMPE